MPDVTLRDADDSMRCQYPNKPCQNPRTTKRNGGLHRFCALHRENANRNQKRWLENRQQAKTQRTHRSPPRNQSGSQWSALPQRAMALADDLDVLWIAALETDEQLIDSGDNTLVIDGLEELLASAADDALMELVDQFLLGDDPRSIPF